MSHERPEIPSLPSSILDSPYKYSDGEINYVTVLPNHVVKQPKSGLRTETLFEALTVADLEDKGAHAPLKIPSLINCGHTRPYYNLFTKIPGEALPIAEVLGFTDLEKNILGKKIGEFAAWMTTALGIDDYKRIEQDAERVTPPFDRLRSLRNWAYRAANYTDIPEVVADLLLYLDIQSHEFERAGKFEPTMVGHDDIRIDNITFKNTDEHTWEPYGVIDFGTARASTPERELRHMALLGPIVQKAAVQAFEAHTGRSIDQELLRFWALTQVSNNYAHSLMSNNYAAAAQKRILLSGLIPNKDWPLPPIRPI